MAAGDDDEELTDEDVRILAERKEHHQRRLRLFATLERRIGIPEGFFWSLSRRLSENTNEKLSNPNSFLSNFHGTTVNCPTIAYYI